MPLLLALIQYTGKSEIMKAYWKMWTVPLRGEECGSN